MTSHEWSCATSSSRRQNTRVTRHKSRDGRRDRGSTFIYARLLDAAARAARGKSKKQTVLELQVHDGNTQAFEAYKRMGFTHEATVGEGGAASPVMRVMRMTAAA